MKESFILGDYTFELLPERQIELNDGRALVIVEIPGGKPKIQDMGSTPKPISWAGTFVGENAMKESYRLVEMLYEAKRLRFTYGPLNTLVRIKDYKRNIIRFDYVRYTIELLEDIPQKSTLGSNDDAQNIKIAAPQQEAPKQRAVVTMKKGDTLWALGKQYGIPWQTIAEANGITNPRKIPVGQQIVIP